MEKIQAYTCCFCGTSEGSCIDLTQDQKDNYRCSGCYHLEITLDQCAKPAKEEVNHPSHYQGKNGIEVIDIIESFNLDFNLGNAVKYILRADKKGNRLQDLKKASWYINRSIEKS